MKTYALKDATHFKGLFKAESLQAAVQKYVSTCDTVSPTQLMKHSMEISDTQTLYLKTKGITHDILAVEGDFPEIMAKAGYFPVSIGE